MKRIRIALLNRKDVVSGRVIINILEKADPDGLVHGITVAEIASIIGKQSGLGEHAQSELWLAGLLHDIGKLGVPSEVLGKKKLSKADLEYIRKHAAIGKFIVDQFFAARSLGRIIEAHHERYDGTGYPRGLSADTIPWDARVIAIADYYDTARAAGWLLTHRSHETVINEIEKESSKAFDPELVKVMQKAKTDIQIAYNNIRQTKPKDLRKWL